MLYCNQVIKLEVREAPVNYGSRETNWREKPTSAGNGWYTASEADVNHDGDSGCAVLHQLVALFGEFSVRVCVFIRVAVRVIYPFCEGKKISTANTFKTYAVTAKTSTKAMETSENV